MSFCGLAILSQNGLNYSLRLFFLPILLKICFHYYNRKKLKTNRFDSSIHNKPLDSYLMKMCVPGIIKQSWTPNQYRLVREEILHFLLRHSFHKKRSFLLPYNLVNSRSLSDITRCEFLLTQCDQLSPPHFQYQSLHCSSAASLGFRFYVYKELAFCSQTSNKLCW